MKKAETASADIAAQFEELLVQNSSAERDDGGYSTALSSPTELVINGSSYIGILSVPSLELWLPVRADLSYAALRESPCLYSGSVPDNNLVIAAHNYPAHFGTLDRLANGECVRFMDAGGRVTEYIVIQTEILAPGEVERMTCGDYDLTLFTCTPGGGSRATVRCMRA